jgi:serine/threonine protein kinase
MAYTFKHGDRPLEGFTIQRAIGRGGFGEVYYAISDGGREVALKYLKENPHVELRGVGHCMNLKSPHLVSIFDVKSNADGEYFIIMEYISGPSLRDLLIAEPRGFAPEKAAFFTKEIAKGLAYLHDRGIVHRDLKPGNIFFDDGYVKIGDYGLSKFIAVSRHSAQTASVGTVHYMAPEIGSGNYSRGVDIYALGVMLYEMLLGKVPFEGSSMAEVLMKHLSSQPELDELPAPFGDVIRKALAKDPKDRYQTVEEMTDEMLSGEAIQKSLAGFSAKSLEGAVRLGGRDADSPRPSPNPPPRFARTPNMGPPPSPYAPVAPGAMPLPDKVARKMERLARRVDERVAKFRGTMGAPNPPASGQPAVPAPFARPLPARSVYLQRNAMMFVMTVALAIGYGVLVGCTSHFDVAGPAAGLLVGAMIGGVGLGRLTGRWFSVASGPKWAERALRAFSAAPLLATASAPLLSDGHAIGLFLGLTALAAFANWAAVFEPNDDGEISFGGVFKMALGALVLTAIGEGIVGGRGGPDEHLLFIAAGVGAITSFVIQAGTSWLAHQTRPARVPPIGPPSHPDPASPEAATVGVGNVPLPNSAGYESWPGLAASREAAERASDAARRASETAFGVAGTGEAVDRVPRSSLVRMFWALVAFVLMGGAIVTFLIPLLTTGLHHFEITTAIIACTGCTAFMLFAMRKTMPLRPLGFWRNTARPFFISLALFGIGGTITGIAREWNHCEKWAETCDTSVAVLMAEQRAGLLEVEANVRDALPGGVHPPHPPDAPSIKLRRCLQWSTGEEEKVAMVTGLVMSSLVLIAVTFLRGGRRRTPQPFLNQSPAASPS